MLSLHYFFKIFSSISVVKMDCTGRGAIYSASELIQAFSGLEKSMLLHRLIELDVRRVTKRTRKLPANLIASTQFDFAPAVN